MSLGLKHGLRKALRKAQPRPSCSRYNFTALQAMSDYTCPFGMAGGKMGRAAGA